MEKKRIEYIDGFRGIAIILVVVYHAYARWPEILPYGNAFSWIPIFDNGWLGVELFFLISGFVILMTLEKSISFQQFMVKRWLRLFPAMLAATILIFFTASLLPERPAGIPRIADVIPGLLFVEPSWISKLFNVQQGYIEGSFWSLWAEFKFYVIFGLLYFSYGRNKAIGGLLFLYLLCMLTEILNNLKIDPIASINALESSFSLEYFGWFATGALMYLYSQEARPLHFFLAAITGFISVVAVTINHGFESFMFALILLTAFIATVRFARLQAVIGNKTLLWIGFISYPLYLIHENAMIALTVKIYRYFPLFPQIFLPVIPILFLCLIAYLIARYVEPFLKIRLTKIFVKNKTANANSSEV